MAVDTPARIVIIGAGPIGIEAALYARFLGYEVTLFDRGRVGENLRQWGHVKMFTPLGMNTTPLGKSALLAQNERFNLPADELLLTGQEFVDHYLQPLAETDLVASCLKLNHTVISIARKSLRKADLIGQAERADYPFITLYRDAQGHEATIESEVVLDCSGVYDHVNYMGLGGNPAIGELAARPHLDYRLINAAGRDREHYANRQILVIGTGYSAATNICQLGKLARQALETHVTWITREPVAEGQTGPLRLLLEDRLPERQRIAMQANELASNDDRHITHWPGTWVKSIHYEPHNDHFHVTLEGQHSGVYTYDRVLANVGYRPDLELTRELQVHTCYATEGPMKLSAELLKLDTPDCLNAHCGEAQTLVQAEPNFYVLGSKSYGRQPNFLLQAGLDQIRLVFSIIGGRENLNLYAKPLTDPQ